MHFELEIFPKCFAFDLERCFKSMLAKFQSFDTICCISTPHFPPPPKTSLGPWGLWKVQ